MRIGKEIKKKTILKHIVTRILTRVNYFNKVIN